MTTLTLDAVASTAVEVLLRDQEHLPMVLAEGKRNVTVLGIEMPSTPAERRLMLAFAGAKIKELEPEIGALQQAFLISEAWEVHRTEEQPVGFRPSEQPDRIEVLMISRWQRERPGESTLRRYKMLRNQEEVITDVVRLSEEGGVTVYRQNLMDALIQGYDGA